MCNHAFVVLILRGPNQVWVFGFSRSGYDICKPIIVNNFEKLHQRKYAFRYESQEEHLLSFCARNDKISCIHIHLAFLTLPVCFIFWNTKLTAMMPCQPQYFPCSCYLQTPLRLCYSHTCLHQASYHW